MPRARHGVCSLRFFVTMIAVLLLLLVLAFATLPMWPYSTRWTYYPAGSFGLAAAVIVYLTLEGML